MVTKLYFGTKYNFRAQGMVMIPSPYTPGSVPTKLSGRADKLNRFREAAQTIESNALFVPRIHVDHGPRGVGKTSLLTEAQR